MKAARWAFDASGIGEVATQHHDDSVAPGPDRRRRIAPKPVVATPFYGWVDPAVAAEARPGFGSRASLHRRVGQLADISIETSQVHIGGTNRYGTGGKELQHAQRDDWRQSHIPDNSARHHRDEET